MWCEIYEICCQQPVFHSIVLTFQRQAVAWAMEMAIETTPHTVAAEQLQNLRALISPAPGRVMEKHQFLLIPGRF